MFFVELSSVSNQVTAHRNIYITKNSTVTTPHNTAYIIPENCSTAADISLR